MKTLLLSVTIALFPLVVAAQSDPITFTFVADSAAANEAAGTMPAHATIRNDSPDQTATNVFVRVQPFTPDISTIEALDSAHCAFAEGMLRCDVGTLAPGQQVTFDYVIHFTRGAGRARINTVANYQFRIGEPRSKSAVVGATLWRTFQVTNANDEGAGSLRQAMIDVNADPVCADLPCRILFSIAPAAEGQWRTIAVQSPLPLLVAGDVSIDATTQVDSNPLGPDVELLGSALRNGTALRIRSGEASVRGFAIGSFPHDGIFFDPAVRGSAIVIENNYIGVDPTGTRPVANGSRGIVIGEGIVAHSAIRNNIISGNARSGIFVNTIIEPALPLGNVLVIDNNRIGVAAHTDDPIGNGASGIFVGPRAQQVGIHDNVIAYNLHMGVAVAAGQTQWISAGLNRIFGHPGQAYDINLNGPDGAQLPVIESAHYDPATGVTTITGRGPVPSFVQYEYLIYANREVDGAGYAEAEQPLGSVHAQPDGRFVFTTSSGDLRGKYIDAQALEHFNLDGSFVETSAEMTRAVAVE
ncbi:MAG TPA: right-handed parallel beta-helix repeat-containing protein [Thermoanaerobaculia bacterium]|jgi:hypothetical protein